MSKYLDQFYSHRKRHLFGCKLQQSGTAIYVLEQFLHAYKPTSIVELGSGNGVLSMYFKMYCDLSGLYDAFYTMDIVNPFFEKIENHGDFFNQQDVYDPKIIPFLQNRLKGDRPFLYVDALDPKSDLVNLYSPHLKQGTIIAAHDFITNEDKSFRWGFRESDINWDYVEKYDPFYSMSKELDVRTLYMRVK